MTSSSFTYEMEPFNVQSDYNTAPGNEAMGGRWGGFKLFQREGSRLAFRSRMIYISFLKVCSEETL